MDIVPFSQINDDHAILVGHKGVSLGKLIQSGFDVPEGYVVTSDALVSYLKESKLFSAVEGELNKVSIDDLHSVDYASRVIKDLILSSDLPPKLETEILQQFSHINSDFVAVRSSVYSPGEKGVAWSGELETILNVSATDLLEAIKRCWISLFSTRSLYYLFQQHNHPLEVKMAVLIQLMHGSSATGRTYTVHPVTRDSNSLVVEAGMGLGDVKEAGEIALDRYIITKDTLEIKEKIIGSQKIKFVSEQGGGTIVEEMPVDQGEKQTLSDDQISEIAKISTSIETAWGKPVEVEWILADKFYLVQVREMNVE